MASPWKFLARLTSRRRGSKEQQDGVIDDVKLEEGVSPEPVQAATDNTQISSDRLVEAEPQSADQSDARMPVPEDSANGGRVQGKIDLESARLVDAAGPALSDGADFTTTPTHEALTFSSFKKRPSAKKKRSQEASVVKSVEVSPQLPTSVPTFSDEVQTLDEEIRLLRDQLARKLQLQNAQLRIMLERFER
ncbi:hypothetical protein B5P46_01400 [Rhizobium leguminosarum]|uniref:Uncharacterized protein n=1 Tax=Rhizobium leguminosarum TaxID=384 RepID=A0A4Q1UCK0_RHILE|nr:hypothetical protein [Rhizobium leguminosarum]RXT29769.1 hypothetical protein B5P46_01400 [Rhizobium leguminosarum]